MFLCEYGCGQEAKYKLKNEKWCCSKFFNSCPSIRKRNSETNKVKQAGENNGMFNKKQRKSNKRPYIERFGKEKTKYIIENLKNKLTGQKRTPEQKKRMSDRTRANKEYMKRLKKEMKNGKAAWMNSFIKNPSKPQVELYKMVLELCPYAILNYPSLNYSIDIAIPFLNIAIEYDSSYWHQNKHSDKIRQNKLEKEGWEFIRFNDYIPTIKKLKTILLKEVKFEN